MDAEISNTEKVVLPAVESIYTKALRLVIDTLGDLLQIFWRGCSCKIKVRGSKFSITHSYFQRACHWAVTQSASWQWENL